MNRTYAEAAAELGVPQTWLEKKVAARAIRHSRYGRYVRFSDEDIAWIRENAIQQPDIRTTPLAVLRERAAQRGRAS